MSVPGRDGAEKNLGEIVVEISEKASLLVREEIELAKAEIVAKARKVAGGAAAGAAAGVFVVFAIVMLLHTIAWLLVDAFDMPIWAGFAMVTLLLLLLALIAGVAAARLVSRGAPPTPDMAIEEARRTRESLKRQSIGRDQLERGKEAEAAASKETI